MHFVSFCLNLDFQNSFKVQVSLYGTQANNTENKIFHLVGYGTHLLYTKINTGGVSNTQRRTNLDHRYNEILKELSSFKSSEKYLKQRIQKWYKKFCETY